ncbi:MAG: hypothetical protein WAU49_07275 [Steroidobacteraceae bacterium]
MQTLAKSLAKSLTVLVPVLALAGCGLAATSVTAAAGGASAAQDAKQAKDTEAKMQQQINAAYQQDAANRKAAEAQAQ